MSWICGVLFIKKEKEKGNIPIMFFIDNRGESERAKYVDNLNREIINYIVFIFLSRRSCHLLFYSTINFKTTCYATCYASKVICGREWN